MECMLYLDNPEADVHSGAHALVRDNFVYVRMCVECGVQEAGFPPCYHLLSVHFVRESGEQLLEHLASHEDADFN